MNFKKLSIAMILAATLAGCASEEPSVVNPEQADGGYMAVNINLPTTGASSRAISYSDGTADEYLVDNATLLVFKKTGASELDYTFVEAAKLTGIDNWNTSSDAQITTQGKGVAHLSSNISLTNSDVYYGLVILNNPAENGINLPTASSTYGQWLNTAQTPAIGTALYMANAPQYKSNSMPLTLVELNKAKITATENEAINGDAAANIFVERGVAKVTITSESVKNKNVAGSAYSGDEVTITKWALDITNKSTYPVHNVDGLSTSYTDIWTNTGTSAPCTARFVGGNDTFKRVFWAKDPNYNQAITSAAQIAQQFDRVSNIETQGINDINKAFYCFENTFDIEHMMQGQTTRVVFKAVYKPASMAKGTTFLRIGNQSTLWSVANLTNQIKAKAESVLGVTSVNVNINSIANTAGNHKLTSSMISLSSRAITDDELKSIVAALGAESGINTYLNGECYYVARIKHFGDDETPWRLGEPTYDKNNLKYLGRYGMVRNNWYELNIDAVSAPGACDLAGVEPDPTTPDDESQLYISVRINILPWAKRVQNVEL